MDKPAVGWIGTGIMGAPMARNLLRAGYSVTAFNRTRAKLEPLAADGVRVANSPARVAHESDVIISIVSDSPDVEAVYLEMEGVCAGLRAGTLCVDMSTVSPDSARRVSRAVTEKGGTFLDAPVSGGKTGAEAGTLSIMVGGDEGDLARARPIFDVLGRSVVHCGAVGNGQLTKLCNQILCGLNLLAVSEALVFARRVGLDPEVVLKAVSQGAAQSWALENLGVRMIRRDFAPMFMVDLQQKDLRIALRSAHDSATSLPGTALVSEFLTSSQSAGEGREGTQALLKVLERLNGMSGGSESGGA